MELGYRIIRLEDVGTQPLPFAQISLWRTANWNVAEGELAVREAIEIAEACKSRGIRTVFHPLEYPLSGNNAAITLAVMRRLAAAADLGIIIHDEGGIEGKGLENEGAEQYARNLKEISGLCRVSIENSFNSVDITRFWERFVDPASDQVSITLDIGHLELAGLNSVQFVRDMPRHFVERTQFVHMHHHDAEQTSPVKDHRPLVTGCREIEALKEMVKRKQDVRVILELDAADDGMRESIELLRAEGFAGRNEKIIR